ncbi:MAG TPA: sigma 54-interacting transcriptional regulator [Thermoanaerobaculia bacterium]|nr:sigma 54-interacting transcriptional regulator [Thermoanaerobaculia bacterium]
MPEGRTGDDDPANYFGMALLRAIREHFPDLPVAILSSKPRADVAQEFSRAGAVGFLARGEDDKDVLREFLWRHGLIPDETGAIVGKSVALLKALRSARRAGTTRRNVLLRGERGVGKELLAAYLHRSGMGGGHEPFVTVDSGALQASLYASELFGHVRGAFTGADRDRTGRLIEADSGDLFLDEIGNMPYDAQTGLLRAIETGEVVPVGGRSGRRVDVRVLSATNEDIEVSTLEKGGFRADLLDRLRQGGTIALPPLRARSEDILELALGFVREAEKATGARERTIDPEALARLQQLPWPGNIRELRSRLFEAVVANRDVELLASEHLEAPQPSRKDSGRKAAASHTTSVDTPLATASLEEVLQSMSGFDFVSLRAADLVGKLPEIEAAYAEMLARYLAAALRTQLRHTARAPEGILLTHPALVLMTGAERLSATKAYDLIIGLRHLPGAPSSVWDEDPVLREAYERAMARRRPERKKARARLNLNPKTQGKT